MNLLERNIFYFQISNQPTFEPEKRRNLVLEVGLFSDASERDREFEGDSLDVDDQRDFQVR